MEYWRFLREKVGHSKIVIPGADGAIVKEGKILLVRNAGDGRWYLPGGLQELGESIRRTVEREIREELGLTARAGELVGVYSNPKWEKLYPSGDVVQPLTFLFVMEAEGAAISIDRAEVREYGYFSMHALPDGMAPYARRMCEDLMNFKGTVIVD